MSEMVPQPQLVDQWRDALNHMNRALVQVAGSAKTPNATRPFDMAAVGAAVAQFGLSVGSQPKALFDLQMQAMKQWSDFWMSSLLPRSDEREPVIAPDKGDRRFSDEQWNDSAYYRTLRDAYLLASQQMRALAGLSDAPDSPNRKMVEFLLDQYLNAVAPTNFPMTNPQAVKLTIETGGANLVAGFANLLHDVSSGKGIVRRRTADVFKKGENIAATPGSVVFQNHLFQLIQYDPLTPDVHQRPLVYVPPLVNKYYMIDLQPKSSLVRWLVEQGRTVFVVSWVNPDASLRDCGVTEYVRDGVIEAIGAARRATGEDSVDLFSFCMGGTLVALALGVLAARKQADQVGTATLIGALVDFSDMRGWAAFTEGAHLDALNNHLKKNGFIDTFELQQLFAAMRSNDLIWSSVVNHYLLDKQAPPSDLLFWFEDGSRIPEAFLKTYNHGLLKDNALPIPGAVEIDGVKIDLSSITTPLLIIALKDDHVSAWEAVYQGARLFGGPVEFILGGSGHNAGVINPPAANKHGYWRNPVLAETADAWLEAAEKMPGSWWPVWDRWLTAHGPSGRVAPRIPGSGALPALEPAPGSYVLTTHT